MQQWHVVFIRTFVVFLLIFQFHFAQKKNIKYSDLLFNSSTCMSSWNLQYIHEHIFVVFLFLLLLRSTSALLFAGLFSYCWGCYCFCCYCCSPYNFLLISFVLMAKKYIKAIFVRKPMTFGKILKMQDIKTEFSLPSCRCIRHVCVCVYVYECKYVFKNLRNAHVWEVFTVKKFNTRQF